MGVHFLPSSFLSVPNSPKSISYCKCKILSKDSPHSRTLSRRALVLFDPHSRRTQTGVASLPYSRVSVGRVTK